MGLILDKLLAKLSDNIFKYGKSVLKKLLNDHNFLYQSALINYIVHLMKKRIYLLLSLLTLSAALLAAPKLQLLNSPEVEISGLVESVDILEMAVQEQDKVSLKFSLGQSESSIVVQDLIKYKVHTSELEDKVYRATIFSQNLTGPCDYNGFQKIVIYFRLNETNEILPDQTEIKLSLYKRESDCSDKFQAFASSYL